MSVQAPIEVITNGLQLYFDTNNVKSFNGQPTTNAAGSVYLGFSGDRWAKTTDYPNKGYLPFVLGSDVYRLTNGNNYWGYASDFGFAYNKTYTLSFWYYVATTQNIIWHNSVFGTPAAGGSEYNTVSTKSTDTFTTTNNTNGWRFGYVTFSTNIAVNSYSYFRGTYTGSGTDDTPTGNVYIANFQLEERSYPTQYTPGTRSNTNGLLDLTNINTLNLSTAGFDSSANITFNGSTNYINCPTTKTASCTFSCWAKTTTLASNPMLFNAGTDGGGPDLFFYNNKISWNVWDGDNSPFATTPASVTNGNWHNYVVVNDATSNAKLYYDGVLLGTATYRNASGNTNLTVGGNVATYMWNGSIAIFTLHNRVLTPSEILQNYNATRSRFGL